MVASIAATLRLESHTKEAYNKTRNMWGSHRRSGDDVGTRTNLTKVSVLLVKTLVVSVCVNADQVD